MNRVTQTVRWVGVPVAAIFGALLLGYGPIAVVRDLVREMPGQGIVRPLVVIAAGLFMGFGFVYGGTLVAPCRKKDVAIILLVISALYAASISLVELLDASAWHVIAGSACVCVGAAFATSRLGGKTSLGASPRSSSVVPSQDPHLTTRELHGRSRLISTMLFTLGVAALGPLMLLSGALAAFSIISLWVKDVLNMFGNGPGRGGFIDSLYGGPGAPRGAMFHYFVFMISGLIAAGSWSAIRVLLSRVRDALD